MKIIILVILLSVMVFPQKAEIDKLSKLKLHETMWIVKKTAKNEYSIQVLRVPEGYVYITRWHTTHKMGMSSVFVPLPNKRWYPYLKYEKKELSK